ncbi:MAG TPA: hypothetical protein VFY12_13610 [Arenimonas sp.]|nr:hypothetical protein [Arenimonas sp.]
MPRLRRRWIVLLALLAVVLLAAWWINRQLEPQRLTALVLREAGRALDLELSIDGEPQYALRPEPRLVLPKLEVRRRGDLPPLLRARRVDVSLPWATLLDADAPLAITRIELDAPQLDLVLLRGWLDSRPPGDTRLPTLSAGLSIRDGEVRDQAWSARAVQLSLPRFAANERLHVELDAEVAYAEQRMQFALTLDLERIAAATPVDAALLGRWQFDGHDVPVELRMAGDYQSLPEGHALRVGTLLLRSSDPLPDFAGSGSFELGDALVLSLEGEMPDWRHGWPALPPPLHESTSPLAITLGYRGGFDFGGELQADIRRDDTRASAQLRWPELQQWLQAESTAELLPPLRADIETPRIEIDGATLEGVRVRIDDPEPAH